MTGTQIGIKTDNTHMWVRIKSISTKRMKKALGEGKNIIAAGFQGIDDNGDITTLGRGGSDTSAVALATALGADDNSKLKCFFPLDSTVMGASPEVAGSPYSCGIT